MEVMIASAVTPRATRNLRSGATGDAADSRRALLRQHPGRKQRHGAPGCALLLAFLPGDARDVEVRPIVLARELGEKARGGDAAAGAVADIGEVGEVAVEHLVVILPHRHLPGLFFSDTAATE